MATLNKFSPKTLFNLLSIGFTKGFFYPKMVLFAGFFLASVSRLWITLFGFVNRVFLRYNKSEILCQEKNQICSNPIELAYSDNFKQGDTEYVGFGSEESDYFSIGSQEYNQIDANNVEPEPEAEVEYSEIFGSKEVQHDDFDEIESKMPKFEFKFRFPTYEEISESNKGNGGYSFSLDSSTPSTSTNKYEFLSGKSFSHFLEETEAASFTVKELYAVSDDNLIGNSATHDYSFFSEGDSHSMRQNSVEEDVHEEVSENSEVSERLEATESAEDAHSEKEQLGESENEFPGEEHVSGEDNFLSEKDFIVSDFDLDSVISSSIMDQLVDLSSDGFLSYKDFEGTSDGGNVEDLDLEDIDLQNLSAGYEPEDFDGEDSDIMEELRKLEESDMKNSDTLNSEKCDEDVFHDKSNSKDEKSLDGKPNSKNLSEWDSEDSNGLETLWEHQELIEQLKMELKKVRATGLPTILEDSECPKIIEDLKPWKIDEKFQHSDRMSELHKFYKSYRERMRKFDILNYQKMYAIGFLESKDPLQSFSIRKSSAPAIKSILSLSFRLNKRKKSEIDPMTKFVTELHSDLEVVYVGQMCLSWEILHWQYEKALELWESDPYGLVYNEVAGEFQQFQVILQRFIENELFQGPRVENYVKNRCVMRNFLQVPVIRGDKRKEKVGKDDGAITIDMLIEDLEGSMRTIWKFIHADKDTMIPMGRKEAQVELQNPADSVLLMELRTDLQKKEKKLKEIFRSGNCIIKKFQKHQEEGIDHHYFFSQVDMKLVSRVLNMSRITTDQLVWCHGKLSQISFVNRKMHVEPSFLLFPC